MKSPHRLQPLLEGGLIDDVTRQLMSIVGWVTCDPRVAMFKSPQPRGFKNPPY
jgi:hypothetical protein